MTSVLDRFAGLVSPLMVIGVVAFAVQSSGHAHRATMGLAEPPTGARSERVEIGTGNRAPVVPATMMPAAPLEAVAAPRRAEAGPPPIKRVRAAPAAIRRPEAVAPTPSVQIRPAAGRAAGG